MTDTAALIARLEEMAQQSEDFTAGHPGLTELMAVQVTPLRQAAAALTAQAEEIAEAREIMHDIARTVASDTNSILNARVLPWLTDHHTEEKDGS